MSVSTLIPSDVSFNLKENTTFTQYAYDISGAESGGLAGQSISKNLAGDIIAVGAPINSGGGTARGEVRVYQKYNNSWLQLGNDLNGEADNDEFGHSVDLNGDGYILAVGTKDISHNTLVYKYDSGSWGLYGNSIYLNNNLNPIYETSVVATSDAAEFVVSFEFRGNDYSAGNIPTSYSDSTGSSAVSSVSATSYIDDESGLGGNGVFKCTAPSVSFDLIEIYYYAVSVGGNNFIMTADGTDRIQTNMNIRLGINGDFQVYAKTNGVNVLRWWGDYGSTTSATNTWNHLVVQPKERKFWINGVQKNYTGYDIWASSGNWQTTYSTIDPFRIRNGGSTDGNFCRYFRLHSAPGSVSSYASTLYTNRDVVNFGYETVLTENKRENGSTKPKLNKEGNKLTILNELQYEDLVSNGFVQSYQYSESDASWNYLGNKIESASVNDISGGDIAINDEGNIIAVRYPQTNSATESTKVFKYDTSWNQIGSNIDGSATGDHTGTSVVIDGSGDFVAIGSPNVNAGEVNVYQNVSDTWTLYGNKIQGQADNDQFGTSIDMTPAGNILAVGAVNANGGKGNVNIYQYNTTDNSWNKVGGDLSGTEVGDLTGTSVKLNQLGTEVTVGEPQPPTTSTTTYGAHEVGTFLSSDGNRQYVLLRLDQDNITDSKVAFTEYVTDHPNLALINNDYLLAVGDDTFDGVDITLLSDTIYAIQTSNAAYINFVFGNSDITTGQNIEYRAGVGTFQGSSNNNYHNIYFLNTNYTIGSSTGNEMVFVLENTDYPSIKNLGKVRTFELSHTLNYEANTFQSSYLDGFLDISGGELRTRNADDHLLIGGDASMSGNVFVKGNETIENKNIILDTFLADISFTQLENTNFTQYAYDISGVEVGFFDGGELAGHSISTSASGDIIAVGAPLNSGGGTARGEVRVYQKDNNSWLQLGADLNGVLDNQHFGHSVDLNGDGDILAVGTKDISHNTLVYKYDSGSWGLYGNSIYLNNNLIPKSETRLVATSDAAGFVVNYEFRGTDYSAGTVPNPYSDTTGNSESYDVGNDRYIDSDDGIIGGGNFTCTADNIDFKYLEVYYNIASSHRRRFIQGENDDRSDIFELWGQNNGFYFYNKKGGANKMKWYGVYPSSVTLFNTWNHLIVDPTNRRYWINGSQQNYSSSQFHTTSWTGMSITKIFGFTGGYCRYFRLHGNTMNRNTLYNNRDVVNFGYDTVLTEIKRENGSTKPKLNKTGNKLTILNELQYEDLVSNGFVQSYQYSESDASWNYLGNKIESASVNDISGGDIAINDEGNIIAVGYPQTNSATGSTKVFKYDTSWNQVGSSIEGSATGDHAGTAVVMDGTGDFVAIGSPFAGNTSAGEVNVYQNVSDTWNLYGNKIQGQADNDQFGTSLDIDPSGTILAVGAINANAGKGNINIYQYNETDSSWNNLGGDLSGLDVGHLTGTSVKLNQLGTEVSVGEPGSNPLVAHEDSYTFWNFAQTTTTTTIGEYGTFDDITQNNISVTLTASEGFESRESFSPNGLNDRRAKIDNYVFPSDAFSIEMYFKIVEEDNQNIPFFRYYQGSSSQGGLSLARELGDIRFYVYSHNSNSFNRHTFQSNIDNIQNANIWHHLVLVYNANVNVTVYLNGIQSNTLTDGNNYWSREPGYARELGVPSSSFTGTQIKDINYKQFQVFNKLLTAEEVTMLYNKTTGTGSSPGAGGARTFEIEHTKIYETIYNTQSNSAIIGHNEYSRNQFDTALDVSGNVDVSGNILLTGNVTIPGDITVDGLNYNSINRSAPISIDYSDITEDLSFNHKIEIMTNDNSLQTSSLTIHNDLSNNGTFGSSFVYDNSLSVTGSVVVVDASNTNYGSYTVYSKADGSDSFIVGKSASHVFNIVNQSNVGVWMQLDGNSFISTSDENLKKDIEDLEEETDSIMKLRPVKFHWNYEEEDKEKHIGFIAQEVEELFPDLVEENTYPDGSTYKGVDKTKLIPHLVNEIKSIKKEIEELKK